MITSASKRGAARPIPSSIGTQCALPLVLVVLSLPFFGGCAGTDPSLRQEWEDEGRATGRWAGNHSISSAAPESSPLETLGESSPLETLDDVLRLARKRSPRLAAAWYRWEAALAREPQAGSWPDPTVGYGYLARELETRVGPQRHRFSISQMVPLGKSGPAADAAREEARAVQAAHESVWWEVRQEVASSWYELFRLERSRLSLERHLGVLGSWEEIANVRYSAGQLDYSVLLQAQVEIAELSDRLRSTEERMRAVRARLNSELDRDPDAPISPPRDVPDPGPLEDPAGVGVWMNALSSDSPRVVVREHQAARAEFSEKLASRSAWPDLTFGVDYLETGPAGAPVADSGKDPIVLRVGASLPLWWSRHRGAAEEARAETKAAWWDRDRVLRGEEAALQSAYYDYRDADRRVDFQEREQIPRIEQSIEVLEERFAAGDATLLELLDLERTWLESELRLDRARAERAESWSRLETLLGRELDADGGTR